jgi:hypothetical protein
MHIIAMSSSMCVLAKDNIDNTAETGRYFNNNTSDSIIKKDCINKHGNKKLLCENEKLNGKTSTVGKNSHQNKSRNRETQDNLKSNDMKSNDMKSKDMRSKDTKPNESNTIKSINSSSELRNKILLKQQQTT